MPSIALIDWQTRRSIRLDEIENAHRAVGGIGRGRRYATQQINYAYVMLLSSEFQGFCRDLHTESVDALVRTITPVVLRPALLAEFKQNRKLDMGNPNPGNIGADFSRLGVPFWTEVRRSDRRNSRRQADLEMMNRWRNAIGHQDFDPARLGGRTTLPIRQVQNWRQCCTLLALSFDRVLYNYLQGVSGVAPG